MYIPNQGEILDRMLDRIGVGSVEDLFSDIPESLRLKDPLNIPGPLNEWELSHHLRDLAGSNTSLPDQISFLGAGCYDHHVPAAVSHLVQRSEFSTAYTPYQPELSQGTLQALFEFQTCVVRLTGMEVANASLYDGATALAEAVLMALRARAGRRKVIISETVHPEYRRVVETFLTPLDVEIKEPPPTESMETDWRRVGNLLDGDTACVVLQNPNFLGTIEDPAGISTLSEAIHSVDALLIVAVVEPLSLAVLQPPGLYGADVVAAEGQSLGLPVSYGGPHLGMFATRMKFLRQMPGRLVGQTRDAKGRRGYVLTLATREQHIRRERATSNICTNQSLCALAATIYLCLHGQRGLERIAAVNLQRTRRAMEALEAIPGFQILQRRCFNEFVVRTPIEPSLLNERLLSKGILGGLDLAEVSPPWDGLWLVCCTEKTSLEDIDRLAGAVREVVA